MTTINPLRKFLYFVLLVSILLPCKPGDAANYSLKDYNNIISQTHFIKNATVLWFPEIPKTNEKIILIYNINTPTSRFKNGDKIIFNFYENRSVSSSNTITKLDYKKKMHHGKDGIYFLVFDVGELKNSGKFYFTVKGKNSDNNAGSPWELPIVDKKPSFKSFETKYVNFYYLSDDKETESKIKSIMQQMDSFIEKLQKVTGLEFEQKFDYFYYYSRDMVKKFQGHNGNNYEIFRNRVFSCEERVDRHEIAHFLFSQLGRNVGIFNEGEAIYFGQELLSNGWRGQSCDWWTKKFKKEGNLPQIKDIITPTGFYMHDWATVVGKIHYPVSCSFTKYLIEKYNLDNFKKLFSKINPGNQDLPNKVTDILKDIYGKDLLELERDWLEKL